VIYIKKILLSEMKRGLLNKRYMITMAISVAFSVTFSVYMFLYQINKNDVAVFKDIYTNWLSVSNGSIIQTIFFILLPLLIVFPFGTSFFTDIEQGYLKNIYTRVDRHKYLVSKYFAVFVSGGSVAVVPMATSFVGALLYTMIYEDGIYSLDYNLSGFFVEQPIIYSLVYLLLMFLFFGSLTCMSLPITYYFKSSFFISLFPLTVAFFITIIIQLSYLKECFCVGIVIYGFGGCSLMIGTGIIAMILSVISFVPYYFVGLKKDII